MWVETVRPPHLPHGCIAACDVVLRHTVGLRDPREVVAYEVLGLHCEHILELNESLRLTLNVSTVSEVRLQHLYIATSYQA